MDIYDKQIMRTLFLKSVKHAQVLLLQSIRRYQMKQPRDLAVNFLFTSRHSAFECLRSTGTYKIYVHKTLCVEYPVKAALVHKTSYWKKGVKLWREFLALRVMHKMCVPCVSPQQYQLLMSYWYGKTQWPHGMVSPLIHPIEDWIVYLFSIGGQNPSSYILSIHTVVRWWWWIYKAIETPSRLPPLLSSSPIGGDVMAFLIQYSYSEFIFFEAVSFLCTL